MEKVKLQKIIIIILLLIIVILEFAREVYYIEAKTVPLLSSKSYSNHWKDLGYFSTEGTWVWDNDDERAYLTQKSTITCLKSNMTCTEATANLGEDNILNVYLDIYNIDKVDKNVIQYSEDDALSASKALGIITTGTINLNNGKVSAITAISVRMSKLLSGELTTKEVREDAEKERQTGISELSKTQYNHVRLEDMVKVNQSHNEKIKTFKNTPLLWLLGKIFSMLFSMLLWLRWGC